MSRSQNFNLLTMSRNYHLILKQPYYHQTLT